MGSPHTTSGRLAEIEARASLDELVDNVLSHIQQFGLDARESATDPVATRRVTTSGQDEHR